MVTQIRKNIFTSATVPRGAVLSYFFLFVTFLMYLYFLRTMQLLHISFNRCYFYYSEGYLSKENFLQYLPHCWERFRGVFGLIFGCTPLFLKAVFHLVSWKFVQMFLVILRHSMNQKKFQPRYSSTWDIMQYFGAYFGSSLTNPF